MGVALMVGVVVLLSLAGGARRSAADEVDRLLQEASSASLQVRLRALKALGASGELRALRPLLAALHDAHPSIRECAAAALQALARALRGAYQALAQWIEALLAALRGTPSPPVEWTRRTQHI